MRSISISHLKARLSEYLRLVHGGSTLVVTDRGTPVAMVSPLPTTEHEGAMVSLIERGLVTPPARSLPEDFWERARPSDTSCLGLKAVLEERDSGW
jgi:prevent-host-death family protein